MKTLNVRELRSAIPHLAKTLQEEHELLLVSNGEPIARIVPVEQPRRLESLKWLRDMASPQTTDSTALIREERNRR